VPVLTELLKNKEAEIRSDAAQALGELGSAAKEAVPALIESLQDRDFSVCRNAAWALGNIGPEAKGAAPALMQIWNGKMEDLIPCAAGKALKKIDPQAAEAAGVK
jgi:HEAT repeat protein